MFIGGIFGVFFDVLVFFDEFVFGGGVGQMMLGRSMELSSKVWGVVGELVCSEYGG